MLGVEAVEGEIELLAVAAGDQGVAHDHWTEAFLAEIIERVEVTEAFRHLLALDHEVGAVEPVFAKVVPVGAFRLGDFVFVVGKAEVDAAAVQIDRLTAESTVDHSRALKMPTGAAFAPRAIPKIIPVFVLARFPEGEVARGFAIVFISVVEFTGGVFALCFELALF